EWPVDPLGVNLPAYSGACDDAANPASLRRGRPKPSTCVLLNDVEHIAIGSADEEASHAPCLGCQGMHDLVSTLLCLAVGGFDVVDHDRDHGVHGRGGIAGHHLERRPG